MKKRFQVIFVAILLASCTTVANRGDSSANDSKESVSSPQRMGGFSTKKPESEAIKIDPKAVDTSLLSQLKQLVLEASTGGPNATSSHQKAVELVDNKLSPSDLDKVIQDGDYGFLRAHAALRLGILYHEAEETSEAKKYFNTVIDLVPESDLAYRANEILLQLEAANRVQSKSIGAVLPLSGRNGAMGQRALRGLQMGLGLHLPGSGFKLAVVDSGGNPDIARRGVDRLVKDDNVIGIVGSLLSKTSLSVASRAQELKVPSIGLSQRNGLTDAGPLVYRNSVTSTIQVRALVKTCIEQMGMKKFAIVYPNDAYGVEFANIFWDEVLARGGQITAVQSYSIKETDFRLVIQRLVGSYFGEARSDEYRLRMSELKKTTGKKSVRNSNLESILAPIVDFDAIFIPDSVKAMGQIAAMLSYNDVKKVKLIGTNLWNTKDVIKRAGNFSNELLFVDSITPKVKKESRFVNEYRSLYGEDPSLIEIQAYDTGLILRQIIAGGASSRNDLAEKLNQIKDVPGALGPLSINSFREIERPMFPLVIKDNQIVPLF